jgi:hypothetical protein
MEFDDEGDGDVADREPELPLHTDIRLQRNDVRRKIEEMLERRRLREEFGDLNFWGSNRQILQ